MFLQICPSAKPKFAIPMGFEREVLLVRRLLRVLLPGVSMIHGNKQGDVRRCAFIIHAIWEGDVTTVRGI